MAWTTPRTWVAGETVTAAIMNTHVRDDLTFLANVPVFKGYQANAQTLTTATLTAITFDTNLFDTYSGHSTSTNNTRYTAQVAGTYLVIGRVSYAFNATGLRSAVIRVNAVTDNQSNARAMAITATDPTTVVTMAQEVLAVNDYVDICGFQRSGGNLATVANESTFEVIWLHA